MSTKFSKWMIYCASYSPMYLLLIIPILFTSQESKGLAFDAVINNWDSSRFVLLLLIVLFMLSLSVISLIPKLRANTRVYGKLKNNITGEITTVFIPFIITFLTINMNWYGWLICAFLYILCGAIVVRSDFIRFCPAFFFARYRLFEDEDGKWILTRLKKDQFNQILLDGMNGIEAKALTPNLYLIKSKKINL